MSSKMIELRIENSLLKAMFVQYKSFKNEDKKKLIF